MKNSSLSGNSKVKEIGSDFPSLNLAERRNNNSVPPWELSREEIEYVQTGRQALFKVAQQLHLKGFSNLVLPGFFCDSMVEPFLKLGWGIQYAPLDRALNIEPNELLQTLMNAPKGTALLSATYFGRTPDQSYIQMLSRVIELGIPVIEDETHRLFEAGGLPATYSIGSLRKLLPVADGAYIRTTSKLLSENDVFENNAGTARWNAMDQKRSGLGQSELRSNFLSANSLLESESIPHRISPRTLIEIQSFPYALFVEKRKRNALLLSGLLENAGVKIINPPNISPVPSHLVISIQKPLELQKQLANKNMYCPIHWPMSQYVDPHLHWPKNLISLPIDHRYDEADMQFLAEAVLLEIR